MLMSAFKVQKELSKALKIMKFVEATPIQAKAIPPALEGRDVMGAAQTGTGKTAAFGIPLINHLMTQKNHLGLVITPTRELATQVYKQLSQMLVSRKDINRALLIGGDPIVKQFQALKRKPKLIVGTPGRINDHLRQGKLSLDQCSFLVMDEMDRMFDMGFSIQIDDIMANIKGEHQTLMFSATLPKKVISLAERQMNQPVKITMDEGIVPAKNITQEVFQVSRKNKLTMLRQQLEAYDGSIIVFMSTQESVDDMEDILRKDGYSVLGIHGGLRQNKRTRVLSQFRQKKCDILVATDVAARGLDIPHVDCVINYDLPQMPEDFVHRVGRTARAGREGVAITFVTPGGQDLWHAIECLLDPSKKRSSHSGKKGNKSSKRRGHSKERKRNQDRGYAKREGARPFANDAPRRRHDGTESHEHHADGAFRKSKTSRAHDQSFVSESRRQRRDGPESRERKYHGEFKRSHSADARKDQRKSRTEDGKRSFSGKKRFERSSEGSSKEGYKKRPFKSKRQGMDSNKSFKPKGAKKKAVKDL